MIRILSILVVILVGPWALLAGDPSTDSQDRCADEPAPARNNIVYVIDISGSTIGVSPFIISEVKKSLNQLSERPQFAVLFFQNGQVLEAPKQGMLAVNAENRSLVFRWMDIEEGPITPGGTGDPRAALKRAFELEPVLIFVLSDGLRSAPKNELNQTALREEIVKLNVNKVKINCIDFAYSGKKPGGEDTKTTLEHIAADSGGLYKFASTRELGIPK
ncbi:MAG: hypothetical protein WD768_19565 [Phycisphaeraceae bacterium]